MKLCLKDTKENIINFVYNSIFKNNLDKIIY